MRQRILSAILSICMLITLLPAAVFAEGGVTGDIPEGLVIEGTVVTDYTGTAEELTIPEGVTEIDGFAFNGNATLKTVILPQSTVTVGEYAFYGAKVLEKIVMPGVKVIGKQAFRDAEKLAIVEMPEVVVVGETAFEDTAITKVDIPKAKELQFRAFWCTYSLKEINMPMVESIGEQAFASSGIQNVILPDTVKSIGSWAFYDLGLENLSISIKTFLAEDGSLDPNAFFLALDKAKVELRTDGEDVILTPNGVTSGEKTVEFAEDMFCVTDVTCESGNITNQTGKTIKVNDEEVLNNSIKPVGDAVIDNAYLSVLSLDAANLEPEFGNLTDSYTAKTDYTIETVNVTAKPSDDAATVTVNGTAADSTNDYTVVLPLEEGENSISVTVTAKDGSTVKTYAITITKNVKPQNLSIATPEELLAFAADVNAGKYTDIADVTAELSADIDMTGYTWLPIGNSTDYFSGTFNGNGHTISNLTMTHAEAGEYFGLFGATTATIKNVNVTGSLHNTLSGDNGSNFGVIAGLLVDGSISGCTAEFEITGENDALFGQCIGGIVGQTSGAKLENCISKVNITGQPYEAYIGGIAGAVVDTEVINCRYEGVLNLKLKGYMMVGGIAGGAQAGSHISYCVNAAKVIDTTKSDTLHNMWIGGICGQVLDSSISYSTNAGPLAVNANMAGGIVGEVNNKTGDNTVNNCLNLGAITVEKGRYIGGIVASVYEKADTTQVVENCVSLGAISANSGSYHPIAVNVSGDVEFKNNYYNSAIGSSGDIPESVTGGSLGKTEEEINSEEFVNEIASHGGQYRLDENGKLEVMPKQYCLTVEGSESEESGAGMYAAGDKITIDAGSKSGYRFDGWTSDSGSFEDAEAEKTIFTMPAEDITVTANWKKRYSGGGSSSTTATYTVTFNTQGGSEISSVKVKKNATADKPADPTKEGYAFEGWFTDKDCTTAYDFDTKVTKDITLYAKWTEDTDEPADPTEPVDPSDPNKWENPFTDVGEDDWFYDEVKGALENGWFSGTTDVTFSPNEPITRGMLVTVLWRMEAKPVVNYLMTFEDVDASAYYGEAVRWAASEGIVKGYSDTEYAPDKRISREEMAAIINRYADYKGMEIKEAGDLTQFADSGQIAEWARENVSWAVGAGLLSGKGNGILDPQGNTTRAEAAAILQRLITD